MMKKYILFACVAAIALGLYSCGNNNPFYAPRMNPHPQYFMTVKGHIDPDVAKIKKFKIEAFYQTNSPDCEYDTSGIEGAMAPRHRWVVYPIKPNADGNYEILVPLDHFKPGRCEWSISYVQYERKSADPENAQGNWIGVFQTNGSKPNASGKEVEQCTTDANSYCIIKTIIPLGQIYEESLSPQFNYFYQLDFIKWD